MRLSFPWNSVSQENSPVSRRSTFHGKIVFYWFVSTYKVYNFGKDAKLAILLHPVPPFLNFMMKRWQNGQILRLEHTPREKKFLLTYQLGHTESKFFLKSYSYYSICNAKSRNYSTTSCLIYPSSFTTKSYNLNCEFYNHSRYLGSHAAFCLSHQTVLTMFTRL